MIKMQGLSAEELREIARQTADAFYDYTYNGEDIGLIKYISSREAMFIYISAIVQAAYKAGVLYTTSDRREGYLMLSGEGAGGKIGLIDGFKMIAAEKKALGGFGNMKRFISACFCDGGDDRDPYEEGKTEVPAHRDADRAEGIPGSGAYAADDGVCLQNRRKPSGACNPGHR